MKEPLSSFGLTSISVAELMAFIQSRFNFQVSALELMTTASSASLAHAIVHGVETRDEAELEDESLGTETAAPVGRHRARRRPSVFASAPEDHFPTRPGTPRNTLEPLAIH